ncbi:MAG: transcriptional regulator [Methylomonas sp.]|jgi:DNA-binding MarR family transcriptional regulator
MSERSIHLNPLLHQPIRTQIVAFLSSRGEATFSELKRALAITDGNLGAHLNKLTEAGLIAAREVQSASRPQTVLLLTECGRAALADYVDQLSKLLQITPQTRQTLDLPIFINPTTQEIL